MVTETEKVKIERFCLHCHHKWYEFVTRDELRKITLNQAIGTCPNCTLPT